MKDTDLLQLALGLQTPWQVSKVEFDSVKGQLAILIDFLKAAVFRVRSAVKRAASPMIFICRDPELESVHIDHELCIGCKMCVQACPFGALGWNAEGGRVFKCDLCHGDPQCVRFCDLKAVDYVDATKLQAGKMREAAESYSELMQRHAK